MPFMRASYVIAVAVLLAGCGSSPDGGEDLIHVSCLAEPDRRACGGAKPGFYYDYRSDSCKRFIDGGCGGKVPFSTMAQCVATCGGRPTP